MNGWNVPKRPRTSGRIDAPDPRSGSEGEIQILQSALGARLFGKIAENFISLSNL